MRTRFRPQLPVAAATASLLLVGVAGAATHTTAAPVLDAPPTRVIISSLADAPGTGGAVVAADGTTYVVRRPELHVYAPGARGEAVPAKVITDLPSFSVFPPSLDPRRGLAMVVSDPKPGVVVIDPEQPAGQAQRLRTIAGPATRIGDPTAVSWAPDGSLWVVDREIDGEAGIEVLRFAPGADGDTQPVRGLSGPLTGLDGISGFTGPSVDSLADGSAVVGAVGVHPGVLVFDPDQNGNVAPARHLTPALSSPGFAQYGAAADSRGRLYVAEGPPQGGGDWGAVAVYPAGAAGNDSPTFQLTGAGSSLHTPLLPTTSAEDVLTVIDAMFVAGQLISVRLLDFASLPAPPSAPRGLRVVQRGSSTTFRWRPPADKGNTDIDRYAIIVKKGHRVVHRAAVAGRVTTYAVRSRILPRGPLTVQVAAANLAGRGVTVSATFGKRAAHVAPQP